MSNDLSTLIYRYPPLIPGRLHRRYKRFLADIELLSGEIVTAHCPNTGPMIGVSTPGSKVYISQSNNPSRKLAYTWEMIEVDGTWVGINTALPNQVIKLALTQHLFSQLVGHYTQIRPEVPYGKENKSRIDFLLTDEEALSSIYLEVKNTTLAENKMAMFPDTVTTRGQKHLREMMALLPTSKAIMLYFINRSDCKLFTSGDRYDPVYGQLLREAVATGVQVLPCCFDVSPEGIRYIGLAKYTH
ncbi:sugar fermentation stimulation protein [Gloeothece citriformis PCC 7424]|uniref:Sugar fermentation stimulation protein homolog n=1 Tax=Gloeothece citriformis (strain PCC 7424) TaxID=65393 RepID=B7KLB0_GLOC7|nr:DNA/RNA nuclease SfsA [Gloeothece citriformis]ACK72482.1 sugar fermentation stimulation protein [Gloeothece citriformis PCC 7424]